MNYKILQNNAIYERIKAYKEPVCQKGTFLSLKNLFLAKVSYIEPQ